MSDGDYLPGMPWPANAKPPAEPPGRFSSAMHTKHKCICASPPALILAAYGSCVHWNFPPFGMVVASLTPTQALALGRNLVREAEGMMREGDDMKLYNRPKVTADDIEQLRKENEALRLAAELDGTMIRTLRAALNGGQR